jgi:hypothetical protein
LNIDGFYAQTVTLRIFDQYGRRVEAHRLINSLHWPILLTAMEVLINKTKKPPALRIANYIVCLTHLNSL